MADKPKIKVDWKLKNVDTGEEFLPPYPVAEDGVKWQVGGTYAEIQRFGMDPVANWVGGKTRSYTFNSVLFAVTTAENIEAKFIQLEKLAEPDEALGRPPICVFTYGNTDVMVLVENVDVTEKPPRDDGSPRLIEVSLTLRKYKPFSQTQIDPSKPTKESYYLVASAAETSYEAIARRFYGSALSGDRLRKRHPNMAMQPTVGAKVKVPSKSVILREVVQPDYHAFDASDADATEAYRDILDRRATHKVVF